MRETCNNKNGRFRYYLLLTVIISLLITCRKTDSAFSMIQENQQEYKVWVIQEFWHTGIVFRTQDVDTSYWPQITTHNNRNFIDVGWGDEKFYQATGYPVFLAARAILWPTRSVMQIFSFNTPLQSAYGSESRILEIPLSREQFNELTTYIANSYITDESGDPIPSTVYGEADHYFLSTRRYHLFRTCNTWVAAGFREAGTGVGSFGVLNANQLFRRLSRIPGSRFIRE